MAYNYPNNQDQNTQKPNTNQHSKLFLQTIWDMLRSSGQGFAQGLWGKNLNYEQLQRELKRKKIGLPSDYRGRNWLERIFRT